jgi:hypothetical protein
MRNNIRYVPGSIVRRGNRTFFVLAREERSTWNGGAMVSVVPVALVILEGTAVSWTTLEEGFSAGDLVKAVSTLV